MYGGEELESYILEAAREIWDDTDSDEDDPEEDKKTIELVQEELEETYEDDMVMIEDKIIPQLLSLQISGIKGINSIFFEKRKNEVEEKIEQLKKLEDQVQALNEKELTLQKMAAIN